MKTTKEQTEKVRRYLLDCIDLSGYDQYANVQMSEVDRFKAVYSIFKAEYCYPENLRYYGGEQKTFENWLMGLPSCFNVEFRNGVIIELTQKWGFAPEKLTEKQEEKILELWGARIYMAFKAAMNRKEISKPKSLKLEKLLKGYGYNDINEYYEMILESVINGQIKQSKDQFLALPKINQIGFVNSANLTQRQREAFTMLLL